MKGHKIQRHHARRDGRELHVPGSIYRKILNDTNPFLGVMESAERIIMEPSNLEEAMAGGLLMLIFSKLHNKLTQE